MRLSERRDLCQIVAMKHILGECLNLFFEAVEVRFCNEDGNHFIPALADLAPSLIEANLDAEMFEGPASRLSVQRITINERPIDIAEQYINHFNLLTSGANLLPTLLRCYSASRR